MTDPDHVGERAAGGDDQPVYGGGGRYAIARGEGTARFRNEAAIDPYSSRSDAYLQYRMACMITDEGKNDARE